ncbi:DNA-directed RNA polymerase subunit alpha [Ardenticatena maritima]|uniref:DNA-directed RNA polymerase subunit alpha n=1 Tax=Ardenticatena maritima TaxID=872965 RepID=A0A0N8GSR7_9CHLR|nr:DNA-directed RNA polymerase subunit alpha [Ardenticatena maritima]
MRRVSLDIVMPRIEREVVTQTHGRFVIAPLERGYGITVGNALRRVLLSSLPGAAVTSIRVTGVHHEFSPIPGAKEDMIQFILNVKQLRLKLHGEEPMRMRLTARGPGEVTAADIEAPSQVEIVNPELHLLTLDNEESEVEVEFQVEHGRGFSPADERGRLPIDEIPVDAIFSPIRRVRYDVEPERVGQSHDFDRLVISIWTDGTIDPESALKQAAEILVQHFAIVAGGVPALQVKVPAAAEEEEEEGADTGIPASVYNRPIEDLGLQVRAYNCLKRAGITNIGQVLERLQKGRDEMLAIRNFGEKSLEELLEALEAKGYLQYLANTQSQTE